MKERTVLYGADGNPAVVTVDMGPQERMTALLVELFGLLIGYQGPAPKPLTKEQALPIIADCVTVEALESRFEGLKLEVTRRPHASGRES